MSDSEKMAHALGMKACLDRKERRNPWDCVQVERDALSILLCRAWFRGYDDAKRAEEMP